MILWVFVLVYMLAAVEGPSWMLWLIAGGYILYSWTNGKI